MECRTLEMSVRAWIGTTMQAQRKAGVNSASVQAYDVSFSLWRQYATELFANMYREDGISKGEFPT